jgi:neutral trehalase
MQRIFFNIKTFYDAIPRNLNRNEILDLYRKEYKKPIFNLTFFVLNNFILPNTIIIVYEKCTVEEHCHRLRPLLT